jgi:hypothetical protein
LKNIVFFTLTFVFIACHNDEDSRHVLQAQIDSLEKQLADAYKPGLGEFMNSIQTHHSKLWFAGQNQNWKLADFEINEMKESLSGIRRYCNDRYETKEIRMIDPSIDSISDAIQRKNSAQFKSSYILLTSDCNHCHQTTQHEFNIIKIPENSPFYNQDFKVNKSKS